jgi:hypothetical protein
MHERIRMLRFEDEKHWDLWAIDWWNQRWGIGAFGFERINSDKILPQ